MPIHGPKTGDPYTYWLPVLAAGTRDWVASPYFGYGNAYISKNGGAESPATNAPTLAADGYWIKLELTAAEMNTPVVLIRLHDISGTWDDTGDAIYTTSAGSGSGVVTTVAVTALIDVNELANQLAPILANILSGVFNWFTASEVAQIRYALGLSGSTTATTGTGLLDLVYAKVSQLNFTGANLGVIVNAFASAAQTDLRTQIFAMLSEAGKTLDELSDVPAAEPTVAEALMLLYMWLRNGGVQTQSARTLRDDSGATIAQQTVTDNGSSVIQGKFT